jgi:hypothetical protein
MVDSSNTLDDIVLSASPPPFRRLDVLDVYTANLTTATQLLSIVPVQNLVLNTHYCLSEHNRSKLSPSTWNMPEFIEYIGSTCCKLVRLALGVTPGRCRKYKPEGIFYPAISPPLFAIHTLVGLCLAFPSISRMLI